MLKQSLLEHQKSSTEITTISLIDEIEAQIEKIKRDGKYVEENFTLTHADLEQNATPFQSNDKRYPAKFNVLNALRDYMSSNRTQEDLTILDKVIHDPDNKDYDKGGMFSHSITLQLVWKVKDYFPPIAGKNLTGVIA